MNKKIHKKISKLEKFLHIDEFVKKTDLKKLIKANPLNQAKKSINKFYQDYKKIKEREESKKEKKIEFEKQKLIKEEKKLIQKQKIQEKKYEKKQIALKQKLIKDNEKLIARNEEKRKKVELKRLKIEQRKIKDNETKKLREDARKLKEEEIPLLRRKLGIVFQDFKLLSDRSVSENLKFVLEATGWNDESKINSRITEVLEKVHITGLITKYPSQLSGGEQQKVAIARALLNNPKLIIADEPTGNLDPKTSLEVMDILIELNQKGNTILMATHDFILIDKFPNKTYICESGKISEIDLKNKNINTIYK